MAAQQTKPAPTPPTAPAVVAFRSDFTGLRVAGDDTTITFVAGHYATGDDGEIAMLDACESCERA